MHIRIDGPGFIPVTAAQNHDVDPALLEKVLARVDRFDEDGMIYAAAVEVLEDKAWDDRAKHGPTDTAIAALTAAAWARLNGGAA